MKRKVMAVVLAAVMSSSLLAGCGGSASSGSAGEKEEAKTEETAQSTETPEAAEEEADAEAAPAQASSGDTLIVNIWDSKQQEGIQSICDDWSAKSGVPVRVEVVDWDNYWTLLEAGATGGEMPDVFWMHSQYSEKYMDQGILLDLTDYIEADDSTDLANYYEDIVGLYQYDGRTYALPKDYDTIALWYNKDMFDEAGIAYPDETWTWDTLHDVAAQLTKEDGSQYGLTGNTDQNQEGYYNAIYSYGGYVINDAKDKSGYDDENTLKAMEMYAGLVKDCMPNQSVMAEAGNIIPPTTITLFWRWRGRAQTKGREKSSASALSIPAISLRRRKLTAGTSPASASASIRRAFAGSWNPGPPFRPRRPSWSCRRRVLAA